MPARSMWNLSSSFLQASLVRVPSYFGLSSSASCWLRHLANRPSPGFTSRQKASTSVWHGPANNPPNFSYRPLCVCKDDLSPLLSRQRRVCLHRRWESKLLG